MHAEFSGAWSDGIYCDREVTTRLGNRHPYMAPFDVFDTQDNRLLFVVVMTSFFLRYARHWTYGTG